MKDHPELNEASTEKNSDMKLLASIKKILLDLIKVKKKQHNRFVPMADYVIDRWERAKIMGFGEGSSVYDSCLVLGDVCVGNNTWIGPFTILDGSGGGLEIGNDCAISAGVQIYTHDTVAKVISGKETEIAPVKIGNHVYIGPNAIITKGVRIGDYVIVGANSFVNTDVPEGKKIFGTPARIIGNSNK